MKCLELPSRASDRLSSAVFRNQQSEKCDGGDSEGLRVGHFGLFVSLSQKRRNPPMKTNTLSLILVSLLTGFAFVQSAHSGIHNTPFGDGALENNQGNNNSAFGYFTLRGKIFGRQNTATGALALNNNDLGSENTATGFKRFLTIAPAAATRPPGNRPCSTTTPASKTPPSVPARLSATKSAITTRPSVLAHSIRTAPAASMSP